MELNELKELQALLVNEIPPKEQEPYGFLEMLGIPHYENYISRLYAAFLSHENKDLSELFKSTLIELIQDKTHQLFNLQDILVETEVATEQGRIDILIIDRSNDIGIIIENKIYHHLINPLDDYWNHVKNKNKIGLVLTLNQQIIKSNFQNRYINVTHNEWLTKVKDNIGNIKLSTQENIYLTDFIKTLFHLSKSLIMNNQAEFYFKNHKQINLAISTQEEAKKYLQHQLESVAQNYDLKIKTRPDRASYYLWFEGFNFTFLSIYLNEFFEGKKDPKMHIIIELNASDLEKESEYNKKLVNIESNLKTDGQKNAYFNHFRYKEYHLNNCDPLTLNNLISNELKDVFLPVLRILLDKKDATFF